MAIKGDIKGIGAEHFFVRVFDGEKVGDVSQNEESSQLFRDLGNTVGHSHLQLSANHFCRRYRYILLPLFSNVMEY